MPDPAPPDLRPDELRSLIEGRVRLLAEHELGPDDLAPFAAAIREQTPAQAAALERRAAAIGCSLAELLSCDGGLLASLTGVELERSLGLHVDGPRGPILAGAWALEPTWAKHVCVHRARAELDGPGPLPWQFGVPGGLPLAGIAASGFALVANHLRPATLGAGVPGSVRLRELLAHPRSDGARTQLSAKTGAPLADGRNWMLADGAQFHGFEQLAGELILTRIGPKVGHVHTNHCFDPSLRQREARPRSPASFRRLELASTLYIQRRPASAEAVLAFFAEVEREAFPSARARAQCWLAIELSQGRALWQVDPDAAPHTLEFETPLRTRPNDTNDTP